MLQTPSIEFTNWCPWDNRKHLREGESPCPGVYIWGRFDSPPAGRPYPEIPREVIYVGETKDLNGRPLKGRHHRIKHYHGIYPDDPALQRLYVSVFRVGVVGDPRRHCTRAFTRYVEDLIYWEYTRNYGHRPALDYKEGKEQSSAVNLDDSGAGGPPDAE